jgi:outer membrane receptor for ferrienterochelin and colicin
LDLKYYTTESESHTAEFLKTHKLDSDVINAEVMYTELEDHFLVVGIEKKIDKYIQDHDDKTKIDFEDEIDYLSGFIQDEVSLGEKTILTLGLRYDKHERFGSEWSPKVGAVYKLNRHHRIKVAYGHGFNAPTVSQNSSKYKFYGPHNFFGNDELDPETSDSYELGYEYSHGSREFKVTAFQTEIDDLIHFVPIARDGDKITYLYSNIKSAKMQGIEVEYTKKHLFKNLDLKLGYHYLKTKDQNDNELVGKPKHKANLRLNTKLPYEVDGTFRVRYTGKQVDEVDNQFVKLDGYSIVGLQLSKKIGDFTTRFGIENLLDKKLDDEYLFHNKGRLIYLGINYKF